MKKLISLPNLLGVLLILASSLLTYYSTQEGSALVDEFNIFWMFTISGFGLGGLLLSGENTGIKSRIVLLLSLVLILFLIIKFEVGAGVYFACTFFAFGIFALIDKKYTGVSIAVILSRIFTASLFIVSGLIKANDPKGFGYKLEEYFAERSLGGFWESFHDYAVPLAILIASAEVILGLAVLFGGKARSANWTLFGMAVFFAWLTWFTASCNDNLAAFQTDKAAKQEVIKTQCGDWFNYINDDLSEGYLPDEIDSITNCKNKYLAVDTLNFEKDCVNDCGCFGDALKGSIGRSLLPWESFYKDITLLFFVLVLLIQQAKIKLNTIREDLMLIPLTLLTIGAFSGGLFHWWFPLWFSIAAVILYFLTKRFYIAKIGQEWSIAIVMSLLAFAFTYYCYSYLPIKDFRPYAIGKNLIEERTDIPPKLKFYYKLKDKKTGEEKEFEAFPENYDVNYDYVSSRTVTLEEGKEAAARDFNMTHLSTGQDITDSVLKLDRVLLFVAYHIDEVSESSWTALNELAAEAVANKVQVYLLTSTVGKQLDDVMAKYKPIPVICTSDEKVLKTMIRSNPGLMLVKKAVVQNKWPASAYPEKSELINETLK